MAINNFAIRAKGSHRKTTHLATSGNHPLSTLEICEILVRDNGAIATAFYIETEAAVYKDGILYNVVRVCDNFGDIVAERWVEL